MSHTNASLVSAPGQARRLNAPFSYRIFSRLILWTLRPLKPLCTAESAKNAKNCVSYYSYGFNSLRGSVALREIITPPCAD